MPSLKAFRYYRILFLVILTIGLAKLYNMDNYISEIDRNLQTKTEPTIVFGLVFCDPPERKKFLPLTMSLLNSVIVSAKLNNISSVRIHIFVEFMETSQEIKNALAKFCTGGCQDQLKLVFHSALEAVPKEYLKTMIYLKPYRCCFIRLFLPTLLPDEDAAIYLDMDALITGNIGTIWNRIHSFNEKQVIGAAQSAEKGQKDLSFFNFHFGDIPHVPPYGLNSGVLLMNLTKMRKIGWSGKIFETFDNFSKIAEMHGDQRVLNILLHFEPDLFQQIPCNFNFMHGMCDHGQMCKQAETDAEGLQIIHGSGGQIEYKGWTFYDMANLYRKFNSSKHNATKDLFQPIRKRYAKSHGVSQCYGSVHRLLFKQYLGKV